MDKIKHLIPYCRWIPAVYLNLSECYKMKSSEELSKYYQKHADNIRKSNTEINRDDFISVELNRLPPSDLNKYIRDIIEKD